MQLTSGLAPGRCGEAMHVLQAAGTEWPVGLRDVDMRYWILVSLLLASCAGDGIVGTWIQCESLSCVEFTTGAQYLEDGRWYAIRGLASEDGWRDGYYCQSRSSGRYTWNESTGELVLLLEGLKPLAGTFVISEDGRAQSDNGGGIRNHRRLEDDEIVTGPPVCENVFRP